MTSLRPARPAEADELSALAQRSKAHWGYDADFMAAVRAELTYTAEHIALGGFTVAERNGEVLGFYGLAGSAPRGELSDLWVDPPHIGTGIGRLLWTNAVRTARNMGWTELVLDAEPYAEGFYFAMGAQEIGVVTSGSLPGRTLRQLMFPLME
ncbi:GNAT family N-acetyltransferase [Allokutzneria sp. A3M-2-11 16]|uniref:GNAT family N-acetyltransferase n=1 Tax=Allokutzneria sp. A3M-2-11 16 TaxID=2962043 RepID=UPI0020B76703|nr:GNAT family N-acetyltransferase [Allokutzneria sp. A3M-2-11 16]MCP3800265.1 GNAT family N-acetyltransferase [Allokutzneria sp. A3M-2-11 16]